MNDPLNKIVAVLGPTNTGKTYLAIEKMLEFNSGILGFPLRLLAREVYDKCVTKIGIEKVALITGEEKIIPDSAQYFICTVESMPKNKQTWKKSAQTLLKSSWTGNLFVDSVLNQGREEDQEGKNFILPVRWASDPSFKEGKGTIITYSFANKKSKFNYGLEMLVLFKLATAMAARTFKNPLNSTA